MTPLPPSPSLPLQLCLAATSTTRVPGDDSQFLVQQLEAFLDARAADGRPFLAHLCLHSIHEPHPAMPEFYHL